MPENKGNFHVDGDNNRIRNILMDFNFFGYFIGSKGKYGNWLQGKELR